MNESKKNDQDKKNELKDCITCCFVRFLSSSSGFGDGVVLSDFGFSSFSSSRPWARLWADLTQWYWGRDGPYQFWHQREGVRGGWLGHFRRESQMRDPSRLLNIGRGRRKTNFARCALQTVVEKALILNLLLDELPIR